MRKIESKLYRWAFMLVLIWSFMGFTYWSFAATVHLTPESDELRDGVLGDEFAGDVVVLGPGAYEYFEVRAAMEVRGDRDAVVSGLSVRAEDVRLTGFKVSAPDGKGVTLAPNQASRLKMGSIELEGGGPDGAGSPANDLVYVNPGNHGVEIGNCNFHDTGRTMIKGNGSHDWYIHNTTFARNESVGAPNPQHSQAISAGAGSHCHRWTLIDNDFVDIEGTGVVNGVGNEWRVIGNSFTATPDWSVSMTIGGWTGFPCHDWVVAHNTVVGGGYRQGVMFPPGSTGNVAVNNLFLNGKHVVHSGLATQEGNGYYGWTGKFVGIENELILLNDPLNEFGVPRWKTPGLPNQPGAEVPDRQGLYREIPSMGAIEFPGEPTPTPTATGTKPPTPTPTAGLLPRYLGEYNTVGGPLGVWAIPDKDYVGSYRALLIPRKDGDEEPLQ